MNDKLVTLRVKVLISVFPVFKHSPIIDDRQPASNPKERRGRAQEREREREREVEEGRTVRPWK
jgi:hypothetical protein